MNGSCSKNRTVSIDQSQVGAEKRVSVYVSMDIALAIGIFLALIIVPAFWRSRKNPRRRLLEKAILVVFLAWVLSARRACMK